MPKTSLQEKLTLCKMKEDDYNYFKEELTHPEYGYTPEQADQIILQRFSSLTLDYLLFNHKSLLKIPQMTHQHIVKILKRNSNWAALMSLQNFYDNTPEYMLNKEGQPIILFEQLINILSKGRGASNLATIIDFYKNPPERLKKPDGTGLFISLQKVIHVVSHDGGGNNLIAFKNFERLIDEKTKDLPQYYFSLINNTLELLNHNSREKYLNLITDFLRSLPMTHFKDYRKKIIELPLILRSAKTQATAVKLLDAFKANLKDISQLSVVPFNPLDAYKKTDNVMITQQGDQGIYHFQSDFSSSLDKPETPIDQGVHYVDELQQYAYIAEFFCDITESHVDEQSEGQALSALGLSSFNQTIPKDSILDKWLSMYESDSTSPQVPEMTTTISPFTAFQEEVNASCQVAEEAPLDDTMQLQRISTVQETLFAKRPRLEENQQIPESKRYKTEVNSFGGK
jgi:hypothetical protein